MTLLSQLLCTIERLETILPNLLASTYIEGCEEVNYHAPVNLIYLVVFGKPTQKSMKVLMESSLLISF